MKGKLLFIISRFLDGGIDTVLVEYLRQIVKSGDYAVTLAIGIDMGRLEVFRDLIPAEVNVVYFNSSKLAVACPRKKIQGRLPKWQKVADELFINPFRRVSARKKLKKLAQSHDVVIDFACSYSSFMDVVTVPKICFYHFSLSTGGRPISEKEETRVRKRLSKYDRIIAISKAMEDEFKEHFPESAERIRTIYNAKDVDALLAKCQTDVGSCPTEPYMLAVERLEESQKDITTLLRAVRILKTDYGFTMPLYILGQGKSESYLKAKAKELDVDDRVNFVGFCPNPFPWLKRCFCLLHSAKFEGLPTVLIEGLLLDTYIISSDCPTGPKEILNNGEAGILFPPGDAAELAKSVIRLAGDESLRNHIRQGIQEHKRNFTFACTYKQFTGVLDELMFTAS